MRRWSLMLWYYWEKRNRFKIWFLFKDKNDYETHRRTVRSNEHWYGILCWFDWVRTESGYLTCWCTNGTIIRDIFIGHHVSICNGSGKLVFHLFRVDNIKFPFLLGCPHRIDFRRSIRFVRLVWFHCLSKSHRSTSNLDGWLSIQ